jgi:hypothetical protein
MRVCNSRAPFTWDRDEVKPECKLKLSTCLQGAGTKITKFSIYSPCQGILIFRWLLLACVAIPMSRLQPRPVWNVFLFTFIPVWIHAGLKSVARPSRPNELFLRSVWVIFVSVSRPDSTTAKFFARNRVCRNTEIWWMAAHEWFYWICTLFSLSQWVELTFSRSLIYLHRACTISFRAKCFAFRREIRSWNHALINNLNLWIVWSTI